MLFGIVKTKGDSDWMAFEACGNCGSLNQLAGVGLYPTMNEYCYHCHSPNYSNWNTYLKHEAVLRTCIQEATPN